MTTDIPPHVARSRVMGARRSLVARLATAFAIIALVIAALIARAVVGGPIEVRAVDAAPVVELSTALPTIEPAATLPPELIDPTTGQKIWWTVGGPLKVSDLETLTRAGQVNDDTACPNGEECPDPIAP